MIHFTLDDSAARPIIAHGLMANIVPLPIGDIELSLDEANELHKYLGYAITNYNLLIAEKARYEKQLAQWEANNESQNPEKASTQALAENT